MPENNDTQQPRPDGDPEHEGRTTPESATSSPGVDTAASPPVQAPPPAPPVTPKPPAGSEPEDEEEELLRMSFLEHLEELRMRIIRALMGLGIAFILCILFTDRLWDAVRRPAVAALTQLGYPPELAQLTPTEAFTIIWVKLPILAALFLSSPWIVYQAWAFISPGLYRRERRLAVPFIFCTAGLFILGGLFAYFVAFRFGLVFLLGIGSNLGVRPYISLTEYFDLFVNVILGVALIFELPVLIFFLTLLRIASPRFLLRHSRYAILIIVILAAIITPTPDAINLTIFAAPMILLYFVGVFASYLLVLHREGEKFPWRRMFYVLGGLAALAAATAAVFLLRFGYHWVWKWPFLVK
ncbi:MAG: twin-arginine translocase subunit TatC [Bryobacteraceae bacterium]